MLGPTRRLPPRFQANHKERRYGPSGQRGKWQPIREQVVNDTDEDGRSLYVLVRQELRRNFRDWVTKDGNPVEGSSLRLQGRARTLSPLRVLCRSLGPSHVDLPQAQEVEDVISYSVVHQFHGRERLDLRRGRWRHRRHALVAWSFLRDNLHQGRPGLHRPPRRDRAGPVGQEDRDGRLQRQSSEINRMLNSPSTSEGGDASVDLYPAHLRREIDGALTTRIYPSIKMASIDRASPRSQHAYEEAFDELFDALEELERAAGTQPLIWLATG